ncbi:hypothetical protein BH24ACI3_BH24ACI3_13920 [soil metagenome]
MSIFRSGLSAVGRLATVAILLLAFLAGMAGVVYMSLSGDEIMVPEIVGKDFVESEKQLAALGLKLKRRADRPSNEKINTVLEQLPRAGETVKSGQTIRVVVSKAGGPGEQVPATLKEDVESDDTEKIEEMISDKPKKARVAANTNANSNTNRKIADTKRDAIANTATSASSNTASPGTPATGDDSGRRDGGTTGDRPTRNTPTPPTKPVPSPPTKPAAGDVRPRSTPRP